MHEMGIAMAKWPDQYRNQQRVECWPATSYRGFAERIG